MKAKIPPEPDQQKMLLRRTVLALAVIVMVIALLYTLDRAAPLLNGDTAHSRLTLAPARLTETPFSTSTPEGAVIVTATPSPRSAKEN